VIDRHAGAPDAAAPRASGTLESHYAPHTPVAMQDTATLAPRWPACMAGRKVALIHYSAICRPPRGELRCRPRRKASPRAVRGAARDGRHRRRPDPGRGAAAGRRLAGRQRPPAPRRARVDRHRARLINATPAF
jgi:hypothetical protein